MANGRKRALSDTTVVAPHKCAAFDAAALHDDAWTLILHAVHSVDKESARALARTCRRMCRLYRQRWRKLNIRCKCASQPFDAHQLECSDTAMFADAVDRSTVSPGGSFRAYEVCVSRHTLCKHDVNDYFDMLACVISREQRADSDFMLIFEVFGWAAGTVVLNHRSLSTMASASILCIFWEQLEQLVRKFDEIQLPDTQWPVLHFFTEPVRLAAELHRVLGEPLVGDVLRRVHPALVVNHDLITDDELVGLTAFQPLHTWGDVRALRCIKPLM